jgi:predicted aspartyl protease
VALAASLFVAAPAAAQIYQWTDESGVLHYTTDLDRIPPAQRAGARVLDSRPREPEPAAPTAAPATLPISTSGQVLAPVVLNGVSLVLVVDTGADRTMLLPSALARAGLSATEGRAVGVIGIGGAASAIEVTVPRIDVAGVMLGPASVLVHDARLPGVDGLLGRDLLGSFTLTVDTASGRATLVPRD